jgi:hypothetical protein
MNEFPPFDATTLFDALTGQPRRKTTLPPKLDGAVLRLEEWLERDLPPPDPLMGHWLTSTSRILFPAASGIGKSLFWIALGMAMAAGMPFLRWVGRRPCRVLYIDGEMSSRLLKERLAAEVERLGVVPAGFHALSHEDIENFAPLDTPEGQKTIEEVIARIGDVNFSIFDNIMSLISGDMKEEEGWRRTIPWQHSLTKRKIGQAWLHHTGHDETKSYGTKTREWLAIKNGQLGATLSATGSFVIDKAELHWLFGGEPSIQTEAPVARRSNVVCAIEGCEAKAAFKGLCSKHYRRQHNAERAEYRRRRYAEQHVAHMETAGEAAQAEAPIPAEAPGMPARTHQPPKSSLLEQAGFADASGKGLSWIERLAALRAED